MTQIREPYITFSVRHIRRLLALCLIEIAVILICVISSEAEAPLGQGKPTNIVAVIRCDYPPVSFWDRQANKPSGFFVDIMASISRRTGLEVNYICKNGWPELISSIENGEADLGVLLKSGEREKKFLFSAPIDMTYLSFFARSQSGIDADRVPAGYTVGVIEGSMSYEQLKNRTDLKLQTVDSYQEGIFSLLAGEIGLFAGEESMILKQAREATLDSLIKKVGVPFDERERGFAVRKDNVQLLELLNKALHGFIGNSEYQRIYLKWFGAPTPYWTSWRILTASGVFLLIVIFGMASWRYRSLSKINNNMIKEITERKRAEASRHESDARYRALFEGSPDAIFFADPETGIILGANTAASRLLKCTHEKLIGLHQSKLHPPRKEKYSREVFIRHVEETREQKASHPSEMTVLRPDGSEVPVEVLAQLVDIGGKKVLIGVFRDITVRKEAENALQKRDVQLSESQRIAQIGSWERDVATNRISGSDELYRILDLDSQNNETSYRALLGIMHPEDRERFITAGQEAIHGYSPYGMEFRIVRKDGTVASVYSRGEVVRNERGDAVSFRGTLQDITERKKLEAQLLQAQKMEAVGQLAGGIAHDFNNILTAIIGYSSMVLLKMRKNDPLRQNMDNILASAGRAANLTQNLLAFSRKQVMQAKPVSLNGIIKNINSLLSRIIGEDIELTTNLASEELTIRADSGQLEQVLMNLAANARDAMPAGGTLSLRTSQVIIDSVSKRIYGHGKLGNYALLSFSDSGEGMDGATQAKAFEPFFTTKEVSKGTGLGLSIVYGIIKQHDGYITIDSVLGKGTTFNIYLPLIPSDREAVTSEELTVLKGGTETILLAEDDESIRELMSEELISAGYAVIVANDGEDAIQKFMKDADKIRLLILDVIMPKKSGKEAYDTIKQWKSSIKALFLSGYSADIIQKKGLLDTGLNFIYKPITPNGLLQKVREILDKRPGYAS